MTKWMVERRPDEFETVIAEAVEHIEGGLNFYTDTDQFESKLVIGIAAGRWITYFPEEED